MPVLERFSPFRELDLMERRTRRVLSGFPTLFMPGVLPAADVYETDDELVVELEVPGYEEEELQVEASGHTLTIRGVREQETEGQERTMRLHERLEASFERRFDLPAAADSARASAQYANGVLTLHVPKMPDPKPLRIEIARK